MERGLKSGNLMYYQKVFSRADNSGTHELTIFFFILSKKLGVECVRPYSIGCNGQREREREYMYILCVCVCVCVCVDRLCMVFSSPH